MADSKNFKNGSNKHNGAAISQSGTQQFGKGPKPGQSAGGGSSWGGGGSQPSPADKRRQAMKHGGSQKKGR